MRIQRHTKKTNKFSFKNLLLGIVIFCSWNTQAQNEFDIRFALDTVDCTAQTVCYEVQLRSSNATTWGLAGQNYRLYYNSALISWQTGTSLLPSSYQNFTLVQDAQNVDADHINGNLNFEADLGFLNYAIDLNDVGAGGIDLPSDGTWIPTTQLCFDIVDPVLLTDPSTCLEIVWARDGMTNEYALSFVEISEWVGPNVTTPAVGDIYDDLDPTDGEASCFETSCAVLSTEYDIRLDFDSLDCINSVVCYNVQIRDPNGSGWGLAGQNYRIYYDAALASWQSGISTLGSAYQDFTLIQDIQGVNATTPSGNLSFEDSLSFLNYTMDLIDPGVGGINLPSDSSWLTTSQLCFTVAPILLNDPGTCLEAVWARDGLTNEYATSFVEISEWVAVNDTEMANGALYDDLESSDGDASCFTQGCEETEYDIRLTFDTLDCINNLACYNVQLRDPNNAGWGLAGQNYRLYYDASLASWISGVSVLGGSYQDFTLIQDIQGVNAFTPSGNLSFEDSLSFLNYTMDLIDPSVGGINLPSDTSWLTTSQLCFEVSPVLLNDPGTCLEAIWARTGLTDEYATSFVEVSEWVAVNDTEMANGAFYDDLESSDGDASCFPNSCLFDFGDLADTSAATGTGDYQTLLANDGPRHLIISSLNIGTTVDDETDGIQSNLADGDGADEDGFSFPTTLNIAPNNTIQLPLSIINTSGSTAHFEAWIDWNGDGDFDDPGEMIFDLSDDGAGDFGMSFISVLVPADAVQNQDLGARFRLSNEDNMTPLGVVGSGEVEDYLIQVECPSPICIPLKVTVKRS
jgi:hypothetical protein